LEEECPIDEQTELDRDDMFALFSMEPKLISEKSIDNLDDVDEILTEDDEDVEFSHHGMLKSILNHKLVDNHCLYEVLWHGCNSPTWESQSALSTIDRGALARYHLKHFNTADRREKKKAKIIK
jgi:hypothetical protein